MRVVITGGSGTLGSAIARHLRHKHQLGLFYHRHPFCLPGCEAFVVDFLACGRIAGALEEYNPDVVVNTAGIVSVEACHAHPDLAAAVNTGAVEEILAWCQDRQRRLVHISTDLVFDGARGNYCEDDIPKPLSSYGRTKLAADEMLLRGLEAGAEVAILRSALLYGSPGPFSGTFLDWMLAPHDRICLFTDEYRSPLYLADAVQAVDVAVEHEGKGLYHLAGPERISRYNFGLLAAKIFSIPSERYEPASIDEYAGPEPRPRDVSLNAESFCQVFGFSPRSPEDGLRDFQSNNDTL
jgi:dTDP-4-dehydrorhamnose reductase